MTDKEFLSWIYDRMVYKHKEDKDADYMRKFRNIIDSLQKEHKPKFKIGQTIKFTGQYPMHPKVLTISEICNGQYWDKDGCIVPISCQDDWELVKEPISDDLEEAAKNHAVERFRVTRNRELAEKCKWSFKAGAQWKEKNDKQPISDDLSAEIDNLSNRYPEVSFAKLSRIAVHVANWQKKQMMR